MKRFLLMIFLLNLAIVLTSCGDEPGSSGVGGAVSGDEPGSHDRVANHQDHKDHDDHKDTSGQRDHDGHDDHKDEDEHKEHSGHSDHKDKDGHKDHDGHGEHRGHSDHGEEGNEDHVELSAEEAAAAGIVVAEAGRESLSQTLTLPAELHLDADRVATVTSQVNGRIERLVAGEGDIVTRGQTLAFLSSRELAALVSELLVASTAENLALATLRREETLYADRITSQADLEAARAALAAARAAHNGIKNKLRAVGIANSELGALANADDGTLATYRIRAPISGVVARRAATLGATISAGDQGSEPMFTIVDDSVLWADIAIYKQDVEIVQAGDPVRLLSVGGKLVGEGQIATVLPLVDETSRTVTARMIVDNGDRKLRPGQFVSAEIETRVAREQLFIPSRAIVQVEGRPAVFVPSGDGFEPRPVRFEAGTDARRTAILSGLAEGEAYVAQGAFTLKAQLEKDAFGDGHAH